MSRWLEAAGLGVTAPELTGKTELISTEVAVPGCYTTGIHINSVNWVNLEASSMAIMRTATNTPVTVPRLPKLEGARGRGSPSRDDGDMFRHGRSITGQPRLWTGRIGSLDEWRKLSAWERHGPDRRMFCGVCREWVMPGSCPHCSGEVQT